jgi:2-methylcitrate dehydratase PrpD
MTTRSLAEDLRALACDGVPEQVRTETLRSLLNVVGTAVGAARTAEVDLLVRHSLAVAGPGSALVPGRTEQLDMMSAALVTGFAAHLDDFDDTHLATVVHPAAAVVAAALPLIARQQVTPVRLLDALALGIEGQLRIALAMTPSHYDQGWHITGTVGPLGAAVTAGVLLDLDPDHLRHAIAVATSTALGHREGFGTMTKAFHPGKAAVNGLLAASLARRGFTGAEKALEGPRGYFLGLAPRVDLSQLTDGLGSTWAALDNTYKPYPCGIVSHPAIEAAELLHPQLRGQQPAAVRVRCHPLVVELTGNAAPETGLAARFSTVHGVAAALVDGTAGLEQYEDARVHAADVAAVRAVTRLLPEEGIARDAAVVEVDLRDGGTLRREVKHARGSLARPLTDAQLDAKVTALVERTLPQAGAAVVAAVRALPEQRDCSSLLTAISPELP